MILSLKSVRTLRNIGTHMALHMSIGLLFIGCGRASLSRSKEAIAALVVALFPRYPRSASDNQYHLQPLRHLWVLAVDWRGLKTVDVETGTDVPVPLQIDLDPDIDYIAKGVAGSIASRQILRVMSPCLLPPVCNIGSVQVASGRYYPATLHSLQKCTAP